MMPTRRALLLFEADDPLRRAERKFKTSNTPEDRKHYATHLRRAGHSDEADHLVMQPHVDEHKKATHDWQNAVELGSEARKPMHAKIVVGRKKIVEKARSLNRRPGDFIKGPVRRTPSWMGPTSSGDKRDRHLASIARLTGGRYGKTSAYFKEKHEVEEFRGSAQHHYPRISTKVTPYSWHGRGEKHLVHWKHPDEE